MTPDHGRRGKLSFLGASLVISIAGELLKWQNPALAMGEKLGAVLEALRLVALENRSQRAN